MGRAFTIFAIIIAACLGIWAVVEVGGFVVHIIYLWWFGVLTGLSNLIHLPFWAGILCIILGLIFLRGLTFLICICVGIWASITILGMAWFWALALYLPAIAIWVAFAFAGVVISILGVAFVAIAAIITGR